MPFQDSCLVGELVELRDVVCAYIRPAEKQLVCVYVCLSFVFLSLYLCVSNLVGSVQKIPYQVKADSPILKC